MLPQQFMRGKTLLPLLSSAAGLLGLGSAVQCLKEEKTASSKSSRVPGPTFEQVKAEDVVEPYTNISFPQWETLKPPPKETAGNYLLVGTAVRCMLGQCRYANARAYAVGLYVEDCEQGRRWTDPSISPKEDVEMRRELLSAINIRRRLVLKMDRDVAGHHVAKGFDRSLIPRIRQGQGGFKQGPGKEALRDFTRIFARYKTLRRGTEVAFLWRKDNRLVVTIDGELAGIIFSPMLCAAIFDTYLGPDSVFSKYSRTSFVFHRYTAPPTPPAVEAEIEIPMHHHAFK